ncbi:MAG: hypothetical protein Q9213_006299 [Squamulea squamosa]
MTIGGLCGKYASATSSYERCKSGRSSGLVAMNKVIPTRQRSRSAATRLDDKINIDRQLARLLPAPLNHSSNNILSEGVTAIATCEATLEAIPQATSCIQLLEAAIPVLTCLEGGNITAVTEARSKQAIFEDIPTSSREFDEAWRHTCALEMEGQAFRPSSQVLWKVWRSLIAACTLKGFSLDEGLDVDSLARTIEEDDVPLVVLQTVIERLRVNDEVPLHDSIRFDPAKSVRWAGSVLLELRTENTGAMNLAGFLRDWKDQLPEPWRQHATLDILQENFTLPTENTIIFAKSRLNGKGASSVAAVNATGPQARKWHEKFKNTRR